MALDSGNDNSDTRMAKTIRGVPNQLGLSDVQVGLKLQAQQLRALEELKNRNYSNNPPSPPHFAQERAMEVKPPDVHINIPDIAETLQPQFDSLVDAQRDLAKATEKLGYVGEMSLRHSTLHSHQLHQLDQHAKGAFGQRNVALELLSEGIMNHERTNDLLGMGNRLSIASMYKLEDIEQTLLAGFGELGAGIRDLSGQLASSTVAITDRIRGLEDVFIWAQRQQNTQLRQIFQRLNSPASAQAAEFWRFGETARRAGNIIHAKSMYQKSLDINPTMAQSYSSLAMIALDEQRADMAVPLIDTAISYSRDNPEFMSLCLLMRGKIERMQGRKEEALETVQRSNHFNQASFETWHEMALLHALLGNSERTIYYLKNILFVCNKYQHPLKYKIYATPAFFPYLVYVNSLLDNSY